jgi:2-polyprenyl-6-hydroxyphenyl methylase / 3-demethylubiquinone-9 3-methyltransferase
VSAAEIDNSLYDALGERWYNASDDPVALLRAESRLRNPWVIEQIETTFGRTGVSVLDIGCGGGFLANALAKAGHDVVGVDLSEQSLEVARRYDASGRARYLSMDAHALAFPDAAFRVVCAMDFLEHTDRPADVVREAARVLAPGGLFFFHTFNRNPLSYLIAIKGVEWFVRNTPPRMPVYPLFIKPRELFTMLDASGLELSACLGVRPRVVSRAFAKLLVTGHVADDFAFAFTRSCAIGYSGVAMRLGPRGSASRLP